MSNGYVFCTKCLRYTRWEDAYDRIYHPNGFLRCEHKLEDICISKLTPHIKDDDEWEVLAFGAVRNYEYNWKKNLISMPCECGKFHSLGLTFNL